MNRNEIKEEYKWNIADIFDSDDAFYNELKIVGTTLDFSEFKGKLISVDAILKCFNKMYDRGAVIEKLSVYAMMRKDENGLNPEAAKMCDLVDNLCLKYSENTAFITPEITALPTEKLEEFKNSDALKAYKRDLEQIIDFKPHVLSLECENLLSIGGKVFGGYRDVFFNLDNVDFPFPTIKVNGQDVKITHAKYSELLQNKDKRVRKKAYKAYYSAYKSLLSVITSVYSGNINKDAFMAKARKFDGCLERALFSEEVPPVVYETLLKSVDKNLPILHKYIKYRKRALNLKTLNMYDLYVPIVENAEIALDYEDAFSLVKKGLRVLGDDYIELLDTAKRERWIDVYENDGKRSGAYSVCVYGLKHPYVLLNHTKTTHAAFTIAHELGHAMHSHFSNANQPAPTADYKIFVAEVASTVNEILLIKYLLSTVTDVNVKKYLLSYYLDTIRTTLFRQTMFAEFEYKAHKLAETGEPITKEILSEIYKNLNIKYYGNSVVTDEEISYEWARIPHFYTAFYVYKYATGIISAINIAENILSGKAKAVENYKKFLSSGSSDIPTELLKIAGVDLTTETPYKVAMLSFESALNDLIKLS